MAHSCLGATSTLKLSASWVVVFLFNFPDYFQPVQLKNHYYNSHIHVALRQMMKVGNTWCCVVAGFSRSLTTTPRPFSSWWCPTATTKPSSWPRLTVRWRSTPISLVCVPGPADIVGVVCSVVWFLVRPLYSGMIRWRYTPISSVCVQGPTDIVGVVCSMVWFLVRPLVQQHDQMEICMVVWCTQSLHRDGSSFMQHQPCQLCKCTTLVDIQKYAIKRLVTHAESHASSMSLLRRVENSAV